MVHGLGERLQQKRSGLKISQKEAAAAIGFLTASFQITRRMSVPQALRNLWRLQTFTIALLIIFSVLKIHPVQVLMCQCLMMSKYPACNIFFPVSANKLLLTLSILLVHLLIDYV